MDETFRWLEINPACCNGRGWADTLYPFDRLPPGRGIEKYERLWQKSHLAAGIALVFETDSETIGIRWSQHEFEEEPGSFETRSANGFDLYAFDEIDGDWRWAGLTSGIRVSEADVFTLKRGHPLGRRRYLLYFPMQKTVKQAWLGINERAFFRFEPPRKDPPLLYYGTSLINGAFSSRPGLSLAARLAREFDCPLLNFGFAGSAEMQIEVAELIAELAPAAILVDVLQNLDLSLLPGRVVPFLKTVAAAHPDKPILVLENAMALAAFWRDGGGKAQMYWWNVYRRLFRKVRRDFPNLHYVSGLELMGIDRETGSDSVHANDIGFDRMFRALAGALRRVSPRFKPAVSAAEKRRRYLKHFE